MNGGLILSSYGLYQAVAVQTDGLAHRATRLLSLQSKKAVKRRPRVTIAGC